MAKQPHSLSNIQPIPIQSVSVQPIAVSSVPVSVNSSAGKPAKKKRGLFGKITHGIGTGLGDVEHLVTGTATGLYEMGKTEYHEVGNTIRHPWVSGREAQALREQWKHPLRPVASGPHAKSAAIGQTLFKQTKEDILHPGHHPGRAALTWASLLVPASRAADVGVETARTGSLAKGIKSVRAASRSAPEQRVIHLEGSRPISHGSYSTSPFTQTTQKALDKFRQEHPYARVGLRNQFQRYEKAYNAHLRINNAVVRAPANALLKASKHLSPGEKTAIRVAAEGVPIEDRIAFHEAQIASGELSNVAKRRTLKEIHRLRLAEEHIHNTPGGPVINPANAKLVDVYHRAEALAKERERVLMEAGALTNPESRVHGPGNVIYHGTARPNEPAAPAISGQLRFEHALAPEFQGGKFRVPYTRLEAQGLPSMQHVGTRTRIGLGKKPGSLTHSFEGKILEKGVGRASANVPTLIAQSHMEAQRYLGLEKARDLIRANAKDTPEGMKNPVAVRLDHPFFKNRRVDPRVEEYLRKVDQGDATPQEASALGLTYDELKNELFPEGQVSTLERIPGIKWIEQHQLGDLNAQNPMMSILQHPVLGRAVSTMDSINNASKIAILWTKLAYALPNIVGNAALTLLQQGWAAPKYLTQAARLNHRLGPDTAGMIDSLVGEDGMAHILLSENPNLIARVSNVMANVWGGIVDREFRRASFLYEAAKHGYRTPQSIERLLKDDALVSKREQVVTDANRALIDYGDLNPVERNIIRRIVFFYPWVKGSTVFFGRFLGDHPVRAAASGQIGAYGSDVQQKLLGDLPSYARELVDIGGGNVINPASTSIFGTPADVLSTLRGAPGWRGENMLTPALAALLQVTSGTDELGRPAPQGLLNPAAYKAALGNQVKGTPYVTLYNRLTGDQSNRVFPLTHGQAIGQVTVGSIFPKRYNKAKLNRAAYLEKHPRKG